MSNQWITVPYSYRAEVLPSRRHLYPVTAWLRGDMMVEVPALCMGEYEAVFELPVEQSIAGHYRRIETPHRMIVSHNGRLYTPLLVEGRPVDFAGALAAFSEPQVRGIGEAETSSFRFTEMASYPLSREHWLSPRNGPLSVRSFPNHALHEGWGRACQIKSDQFDRELKAAGALTNAFAMIDDVMYIECSEPVWTLHHVEKRRYRLIVETLPWATYAVDHFRLDRHSQALAWARSRRIRLTRSDVSPPIDILHLEALSRSDEMELARDAARLLSRATGGAFIVGEQGHGKTDLQRMLATLADDSPVADPTIAAEVMAAMEDVLPTLGRAYFPYLALLLARWKADNPDADLFTLPSNDADDLSPEDLSALQDIPPPSPEPFTIRDEPSFAPPEPTSVAIGQERSRRPRKKRRSATASRAMKSHPDTR